MRRFLLISLLCLSPVLASAQTIAPTAPQKPTKPMIDAAERHFHDGVRFTEEGNYEAAKICFESGYKLSGEPDFLHNLSWTAERQGQLADAVTYAERYLAAKPDADNAERTRRRVELLRSRMGQAAPTSQPSQVQAVPAPQPAPAQIQNAASAPTKPAPRGKVPPAAIGLLAGGGALTLAGVGLLAGAWATGKQAQSPGVTYDEWATLGDRGRALNTGGLSLAIVGGAVVVAGGVWAVVGRKPKTEQPEIANYLR